jgi:hypothetical protein
VGVRIASTERNQPFSGFAGNQRLKALSDQITDSDNSRKGTGLSDDAI